MRSIIKAAAAAVFALGCVAAPAWAQAPAVAAPPTQCEFKKIGEMAVDMSHGVPRVPIDANGQRRWVEVNTAQHISTLRKSDIAALGGERRPDPPLVRTDGKHVQHAVKSFVLKGVVLGDALRLDTVEVTDKDDGPANSEVAGFIGIDLLARADVELDLAHNRIAFFRASNCGNLGLAYWGGPIDRAELLPPTNPLFRHDFDPLVALNGHTTRAVLDTAAPVSLVSADFATGEGLTSGNPRVKAITGYPQQLTSAQFDTFAIGGEKISNPTLTVMPFADVVARPGLAGMSKVKSPDSMLLGLDFLRSHRVLLATSQNVMYFSYNGGQVFRTPPSR